MTYGANSPVFDVRTADPDGVYPQKNLHVSTK